MKFQAYLFSCESASVFIFFGPLTWDMEYVKQIILEIVTWDKS